MHLEWLIIEDVSVIDVRLLKPIESYEQKCNNES
jgi:hypothetical protein